MRNNNPPKNMESFRPNLRVILDATNDDTSAARYSDDVNIVNVWLSYWQYLFDDLSKFFFRYTEGKNFIRNGSIDVTPPNQNSCNQIKYNQTKNYNVVLNCGQQLQLR
jgi:hypothetical protein